MSEATGRSLVGGTGPGSIPFTRIPGESGGPGRQCTHLNRFGEQCKRAPIRGGTVCHTHGGASPMARKAAKLRLLAMVEPAFQVLMDAMESQDENVALKAAKIVLDRAGFGPSSKLTIADEREDLSALTREQLIARGEKILEELRTNAEDIVDRAVEESVH